MNWEAFMALPVDLRRRLKEEGAALAAAIDLLQADIEREETEIAVQNLRGELDRWPTVGDSL